MFGVLLHAELFVLVHAQAARACMRACVVPVFASSTWTTLSRGRRGSTRHARDSSPILRRNNGTALLRNSKHIGNVANKYR